MRITWLQGGWNVKALMAVVVGWIPVAPGFLQAVGLIRNIPQIFATLYTFAWFIGCFSAGLAYLVLMRLPFLKEPDNYVVVT